MLNSVKSYEEACILLASVAVLSVTNKLWGHIELDTCNCSVWPCANLGLLFKTTGFTLEETQPFISHLTSKLLGSQQWWRCSTVRHWLCTPEHSPLEIWAQGIFHPACTAAAMLARLQRGLWLPKPQKMASATWIRDPSHLQHVQTRTALETIHPSESKKTTCILAMGHKHEQCLSSLQNLQFSK